MKELLSTELFELSGTRVTLATAITVILIFAASFLVSRILRRGLTLALRRHGVAADGSIQTGSRLLHYFIILSGLGIGLQTMGIDLSALFAAGAVFAVGIGFAMQNIAQNFVSGMILLVERTIKPHDVVRIEGQLVRVERLGIRATIVRNRDGLDMIVPNTNLVQSTVTNYTLESPNYRIRITVGVTYDSDMDKVFRVLEGVARELGERWGQQDKSNQVVMHEFGNSSVDFQIAVWIDDPWDERPKLSELRLEVWNALKAAGIVIAFPQLDLHLDEPVERSLLQLAGGTDSR